MNFSLYFRTYFSLFHKLIIYINLNLVKKENRFVQFNLPALNLSHYRTKIAYY